MNVNDRATAGTIVLGLVGAVLGGVVGYFAFFWIARQGLYALIVPPALLGLIAGLMAGKRSVPLAVLCGIGGLGLALYTEWRFAPFAADPGFAFFLSHLHHKAPIKLLMLILGTCFSFWLALGKDSVRVPPQSARTAGAATGSDEKEGHGFPPPRE